MTVGQIVQGGKSYGIGVSTSGTLSITLDNHTSVADLKNSLTGVLMFYEVDEPIETITSTLLVAKEGNNIITQEDNFGNEINADKALSYNELRNFKVGGKLVQYINDKQTKAIYQGKEMHSLLGKQNISSTFSQNAINAHIYPISNNSFNATGSGGTKQISTKGGHKYFVYTKLTGLPTILYPSRCYFRNSKEYVGATSFYQGNDFICHINSLTQDYYGYHYMMYNLGSTQTIETKVDEMIIVDLTERGLDNLTAQQFYDRYNDIFDELSNGQYVRENKIYERPTLPTGFTELKSIENTGEQYIDTNILYHPSYTYEFKFKVSNPNHRRLLILGNYDTTEKKTLNIELTTSIS